MTDSGISPADSFGSPPRRVRFFWSNDDPPSLFLLLLFAIPILATSIYFFHLSLVNFLGTPIQAAVIQTREEPGNETVFYLIDYQYQFAGQSFTGSDYVDKSLYDAHTPARPEQTLLIRHLPLGVFTKSCVPEPLMAFNRLTFAYLFFFPMSAGLWLAFAQVLARVLLQRWLCIHGTQAPATISEHTQSPNSEDSGTSYYFTYTFTDPATGTSYSKNEKVSGTLWHSTGLGKPIMILFDPANPDRSVPYELANWEILP